MRWARWCPPFALQPASSAIVSGKPIGDFPTVILKVCAKAVRDIPTDRASSSNVQAWAGSS